MERVRQQSFVRTIAIAFAAMVACLALAGIFAQSAHADDEGFYRTVKVQKFKGTFTGYYAADHKTIDVVGTKSISAVKSTKKGVAKAVKSDSKKLTITMKKAGTTKISFKHGGKKTTVTLKVKKYTCPVASYKIGSKNLASKFKKKSVYDTSAYYSGKLNIKAKKGWKVEKVAVMDMDSDDEEGLTTIKNGSKIGDKVAMIAVAMVNKADKGGIVLTFGQSGWL